MESLFMNVEADYIVYGSVIGIFIGLLFFIFFLFRRIRWFFRVLARKHTLPPRFFASLRNLILILLWVSVFGMTLFLGFFLRAYHAFNYEKPVAEIITHPFEADKLSQVTLIQFIQPDGILTRNFFLRGDQWMIEGDIVKWDPWLNFLGLHTRYRLTRLRGRYVNTEEEVHSKKTIHSLVEQENHPFWQYLYQYGQGLPFVNTVYGNAAFQASREGAKYLVYVGTSGFVVREQ